MSQSPISSLLPNLQLSHFKVAPERSDELSKLICDKQINISFDEETHEMKFQGKNLFESVGVVQIGVSGLERLWAYTFAAVHIYRTFYANGFSRSVCLVDSEEGIAVERLLSWALEGEIYGSRSSWPESIPRPQLEPQDEQHRLTNEFFYGAIGFAILHEIGHIVRNHRGENLPRDIYYRHEFEADEWAYDWIMDNWRLFRDDEKICQKRATMISTLYTTIATHQLFRKRIVANSQHPNVIDRLLRFLTKHANEDCGIDMWFAWSVPAISLKLHVAQIVPEPLPVYDSWRAFFGAIRNFFDQQEQ